jgi:hypothetical protein
LGDRQMPTDPRLRGQHTRFTWWALLLWAWRLHVAEAQTCTSVNGQLGCCNGGNNKCTFYQPSGGQKCSDQQAAWSTTYRQCLGMTVGSRGYGGGSCACDSACRQYADCCLDFVQTCECTYSPCDGLYLTLFLPFFLFFLLF